MRKFVVFAAVAVLAAIAGPGATFAAPQATTPAPPAPQSPSVSGLNNPGPEFWRHQAELIGAADVISAAHRKLPGDNGYAGLEIDAATNSIRLYWRGVVPTAVTQAAAGRTGITVSTIPAKYSHRQLLDAAGRVFARRTTIAGAGTEVVSSMPLTDGSGLQVGVKEGAAVVQDKRTRTATRTMLSTATGGVAITVVPQNPQASMATAEPRAGIAAASRWNLQQFGGARWRNHQGGGCSEGFALGWEQDSAMATAAHCTYIGGKALSPENGVQYGITSALRTVRDIAVIRPANGKPTNFFGASMWWGDSNGQALWPVRGVTANYPGTIACSSGAYSGSICGLRIVGTGVTICLSNGGCATGMVAVQTTNGGPVWGPGDSGGPTLIPAGQDVWAAGIISASDKSGHPTYCVSQAAPPCGSYGWYSPMDQWLRESKFILRTR